jgi:chromosome segregation ATPase
MPIQTNATMNEFFRPPPPPPPPPPFPPRSISLPPFPPIFSTPPSQTPELRTLDENHEYSSLVNQYLSPIVERDTQIRALSGQLRSQQSISTKQEEKLERLKGMLEGKDRELDEKERDLKQSQEVNREHRVEFGKLRADFWVKERGFEGLKGTVERLEREKVELNVSAGEPFAKRIVELEAENKEAKGRIEVLERKEECLEKEVKEVREGLTKRDRDIETLKKEKKEYTTEKGKLVEERDEAQEEEVALLRKIQGLEIAKQKLDELVAQQQGTMADRQREIDRLECDVLRVKVERDNYIDKAHGFEKEKEDMECKVNKLEGKISQMVHIGTSDGVDEEGPSAKRPRTPQSAKRDSIPSGPRAMAAGSPDTPKSMSICSPTDGRNSRLPGNEVRRVGSVHRRVYSSR